MKKKNGFTLIELLAIIVILAIIAVITTPIILEIIDNSKKGAAKDSAYGYKDSISKFYVSKLSEDPSYNIPNKVYTVSELKTSGVSVSGQEPGGNSWVQIENNKVVNGCLQFDEYKVDITNGELGNASNGECVDVINGDVLEKISSYIPVEIVYYNPIDGVYCNNETDAAINKYDSDNSVAGYKGVVPETNTLGQTRCLKWYKYSINMDGTANMILDHNTETSKAYHYSVGNNTYGPTGFHGCLEFPDWSTSLIRSDKYKSTKFTSATDNAIDYTGKKARSITAQEIANITGASNETTAVNPGINWDEKNESSTYFNVDGTGDNWQTKKDEQYLQYEWLYDNLTTDSGNGGYWTSSPMAGNSNSAWCIGYLGYLDSKTTNKNSIGVRPVITIPNN